MTSRRRQFMLGAVSGIASPLLIRGTGAVAAQSTDGLATGDRTDGLASAAELRWLSAREFSKIYDPGVGEAKPWYINDHCFVRDGSGTWHLFGITHEEPADPVNEILFAHATAPALDGPWTKHPPALEVDREYGEAHLWAPHVLEVDGTYYMFYAAGGSEPSRTAINLATSTDLFTWTRHPSGPLFRDGLEARDPQVLRIGDQWVMYYCANAEPTGGSMVVAYRTSTDLVRWSDRRIALYGAGGETESPYVVERDGWWYLLIGPRGGYSETDVFRSRDPFRFSIADTAGYIPAHAPEIVPDGDGWRVSHCGWGEGGVFLATLNWLDHPPTRQQQLYALASDRASVRTYAGEGQNWTRIGGPAGELYAGGAGLFATNPDTGDIYRYNGSPDDWSRIGGPGRAFAISDDGLYGITPDGTAVTFWSGDGDWETIGGPAAALYAGSRKLLATDPDTGAVSLYSRTPYGGRPSPWTVIGGPRREFAISGRGIWARDDDGVFEWTGTGTDWRRIGEPAGRIFAGNAGLFATTPDLGELRRYDGVPDRWTTIGGSGEAYAVHDSAAFARAADGVFQWSGQGTTWHRIGDPAAELVSGS